MISETADHRRIVLWLMIAAQFMFVVDAFIVNVALPTIRATLQTSTNETQGIVTVYQVAFAALVLFGGRLGDMYGSKRIFLAGIAIFSTASFWCGLALSGGELLVARGVQGAGAALMVPQVLSTIHVLFPSEQRANAFGAYGFILGFGGAVGFTLGGCLVSLDPGGLGWRVVFFVNVPIGLVLLVASVCFIPRMPLRLAGQIDIAGALILSTALLCVAVPLSLSEDAQWSIGSTIAVVVGLILLALMWPFERWVERNPPRVPLVNLNLLVDRGFAAGLMAVFFFTFSNVSFYFVLTLYLQAGLKLSPLAAGTVVLPLATTFALVSPAAGARAQRIGIAALIQGCALQIIGLICLIGTVSALSSPGSLLLATLLVIFGAGQAMVMAPLYGMVLANVSPANAGSGGGVISTVHQLGNASGVAAAGSLFYAIHKSHPAWLALGASLGLLVLALLISIGALSAMQAATRCQGRSKSRSEISQII